MKKTLSLLAMVLVASFSWVAQAQDPPDSPPKDPPKDPPAGQPDQPPPPPPPPAEAAPPPKPEPTKDAPPVVVQGAQTKVDNKDESLSAKNSNGGTPHPEDITRSSDFMDTRLTWTFGDDDVTKATGEAIPFSPNVSVGDRPQYRLFFDNLNSRFAGRENLTHLVLYKKLPGYIPNLTTEAALVMRVDIARLASGSNNVNAAFYDSGSYIRLFYKTGKVSEKRDAGVDLTLFPLDTDRMRLGYLYDLSWGGTSQSINQSIFPRLVGRAPGAKLQYVGKGFYIFAGFKTAQIVEVQRNVASENLDQTRIQQTNNGFLAGGGVDLASFLRVDVGGGYFQQGRFEQPDVLGERVYTFGGSARLVVHDKMPVPSSVDLAVYRNDPNQPMVIFRRPKYVPGQVSWSVALEGDRLMQNLKNFDAPGSTVLQPASAAALQGTVQAGFFRVQATGIFRDLAFVVRNQPGYIPFESMPKKAEISPEMFFAFAADYYIEKLHLTPGIGGGLQLPATFSSKQVSLFDANIGRTVVIRQQGNIGILPPNKSRIPIIQTRASLKLDLSDMLSATLWGQLVRDNNVTRVEQASDGTTHLRTFVNPNFIGFGTAMQARF
jgi:hypothetical protein